VSVRSTVDLVDLPFAFAQRGLLMPTKFSSEARDRGMPVFEEQLEALHRARLLVPLLRVRRRRRELAAVRRLDPTEAWQVAYWQPTGIDHLREARAEGRLYDPANEALISRNRLRRKRDDITYHTSVYLYSPYQLCSLALMRLFWSFIRWRRVRGQLNAELRLHARMQPESAIRKQWIAEAAHARAVATAISALEQLYYPQVVESLRLPTMQDFQKYDKWRREIPLGRMLRWLGVNGDWLKDASAVLLREADRSDPLGSWSEIVARGNPATWRRLRLDALMAMDLRVAAEILLRYHDDLVAAKRTKPLPEMPPRTAGPFNSRLRRRGRLDALLMGFGLSPHPRLVLVVEGATERILFPRVMRLLGLPVDPDFIAIVQSGGVDADLTALMRYAASPRVEANEGATYRRLERPPTHVLVIFDAEKRFQTQQMREDERQKWVNLIVETLDGEVFASAEDSAEQRNVVRAQIEMLVNVETWTRKGESFEFAHFTDLQLARAIDRLDRRPRRPSLHERQNLIAKLRREGKGLKPALAGVSKGRLAEALWPVLERRITNARERMSAEQIPIVRIVLRAWKLANLAGRSNAITLEPRP
jgi:hypothetical protein